MKFKIIEALLFASDEPILENDLLEKIHNKEKINEPIRCNPDGRY